MPRKKWMRLHCLLSTILILHRMTGCSCMERGLLWAAKVIASIYISTSSNREMIYRKSVLTLQMLHFILHTISIPLSHHRLVGFNKFCRTFFSLKPVSHSFDFNLVRMECKSVRQCKFSTLLRRHRCFVIAFEIFSIISQVVVKDKCLLCFWAHVLRLYFEMTFLFGWFLCWSWGCVRSKNNKNGNW